MQTDSEEIKLLREALADCMAGLVIGMTLANQHTPQGSDQMKALLVCMQQAQTALNYRK